MEMVAGSRNATFVVLRPMGFSEKQQRAERVLARGARNGPAQPYKMCMVRFHVKIAISAH
jgi:hypothetical protein